MLGGVHLYLNGSRVVVAAAVDHEECVAAQRLQARREDDVWRLARVRRARRAPRRLPGQGGRDERGGGAR